MTHCDVCKDTFCDGDSVVLIRETTAHVSRKSGRVIAIEDPDDRPIARHFDCHMERIKYEARDELYDEVRRQVEEEELDRLKLQAREEIFNEQQFYERAGQEDNRNEVPQVPGYPDMFR